MDPRPGPCTVTPAAWRSATSGRRRSRSHEIVHRSSSCSASYGSCRNRSVMPSVRQNCTRRRRASGPLVTAGVSQSHIARLNDLLASAAPSAAGMSTSRRVVSAMSFTNTRPGPSPLVRKTRLASSRLFNPGGQSSRGTHTRCHVGSTRPPMRNDAISPIGSDPSRCSHVRSAI